jgi:UDP-2,3-diacylglucosamine pyrophosphatase LpxH
MKPFYRSVWISDAHLGSKDADHELLYSFLGSIKCDYLYLVGDMIDVWSLRNKWHRPRQYNEVIHKLLKRSRKGAKVVYIPGNHDAFFRDFVGYAFGDVEIRLQASHTTADGRRLLVLHRDEFDMVVRFRPWLSRLAFKAGAYLTAVNRLVSCVCRLLDRSPWSFSGAVKLRVEKALKHLAYFEGAVTRAAKRRRADGVICGHTHRPAMHEKNGVLYCNTGDWTDHCTVVVEHLDGRLELLWWRKELERQQDEADSSRLPEAVMRPRTREPAWSRLWPGGRPAVSAQKREATHVEAG